MESKIEAVVLKAVDYGEYDKMLTLFSAGQGKISAGIKGVKRSGAKLKFACQPFCVAEYILAEKSERKTVISASIIDSFYEIREDLTSLYAGTAVCQICDSLLYEGITNPELFMALIGALRNIKQNPTEELIKFILTACRLSGYEINLSGCEFCGKKLGEVLFFNMDNGAFTCESCMKGARASLSTYNVLKKYSSRGYDENLISEDGKKRALKLLNIFLSRKTERANLALTEYVKLLG